MKELGYNKGYRYAHDSPTGYLAQDYLPERLKDQRFYEPGEMGFEKRIRERMEWWEKQRQEDKDPG